MSVFVYLEKSYVMKKCLICGKSFKIGGQYYGKIVLPERSPGKWIKIGAITIDDRNYPVAYFTGRKKKIDHWECPICYNMKNYERRSFTR